MTELLIAEGGMVVLFAALWAFPPTRHLAHRLVRTAKRLRRDPRLPRWAKAMFVVSCLPIPGPFDEFAGALTALIVWRFGHAAVVREAWEQAARGSPVSTVARRNASWCSTPSPSTS